jgi:hypothetical protein
MKPFANQADKIVTITIEDDGNLTFLATESSDVFLELGTVVTRRASHVYPSNFWKRVAFRVLRTLFTDDSRVAAWTRTWDNLWRIDTSPVGGKVLLWEDVCPAMRRTKVGKRVAVWGVRQQAIDNEVRFLNDWFARR